jgi:predicted solute-binding protein
MTRISRLGTWPSLAFRPLREGLDRERQVALLEHPPAHAAFKLRDREVDIAFLSPIDYARDSSTLQIVPEAGLWSPSGGSAVTVHFGAGAQDVATLAVDPAYASEVILAKIILSEEFDIDPQIVPVAGGLETMLGRADAALLVGDEALRESASRADALDLIESWVQLTGLPYVHGVWCARARDQRPEQVERLQRARREGVDHLESIAQRAAETGEFPGFTADHLQEYLERFSYDFPEEAVEGLKEFHHYAYYHAVLPDIPEITLFTGEDPPDDLS